MKRCAALRVYASFTSSTMRLSTVASRTARRPCTQRAVIKDSGKPVEVEIAILYGDPANRLLAESHTAAMVCVGSAGIKSPTPMGLGVTATTLAESASCPVAIICAEDAARSMTGNIAVVIDASSADDAALHRAMQEARLRDASVLTMGVRHLETNGMNLEQPEEGLRTWIQRYPVAVQLAAARNGVIRFLADTDQSVQLVVVGRADGDPTQRFASMDGEGPVDHASCSILVVPAQTLAESLEGEPRTAEHCSPNVHSWRKNPGNPALSSRSTFPRWSKNSRQLSKF
jgi:nucleotide-binding universal stress UspA family protein